MNSENQLKKQKATIQTNYTEDIHSAIHEPLQHEDYVQIGHYEIIDFSVYLTDEQGQIIGGILGNVGLGRAYISSNWIQAKYRGKGFGSQLLTLAEKWIKDQGALFIWLKTTEYFALDFYLKRGYHVFAELPFQNKDQAGNLNHYTEYFLSKNLY